MTTEETMKRVQEQGRACILALNGLASMINRLDGDNGSQEILTTAAVDIAGIVDDLSMTYQVGPVIG